MVYHFQWVRRGIQVVRSVEEAQRSRRVEKKANLFGRLGEMGPYSTSLEEKVYLAK